MQPYRWSLAESIERKAHLLETIAELEALRLEFEPVALSRPYDSESSRLLDSIIGWRDAVEEELGRMREDSELAGRTKQDEPLRIGALARA